MAIEDLINDLRTETQPNRQLDSAIALVAGYKRRLAVMPEEGATQAERDVIWSSPAGEVVKRLPYFTTSIDEAKSLADAVGLGGIGGVEWTPGLRASAMLRSSKRVYAATPAMALCLAVVCELAKMD